MSPFMFGVTLLPVSTGACTFQIEACAVISLCAIGGHSPLTAAQLIMLAPVFVSVAISRSLIIPGSGRGTLCGTQRNPARPLHGLLTLMVIVFVWFGISCCVDALPTPPEATMLMFPVLTANGELVTW